MTIPRVITFLLAATLALFACGCAVEPGGGDLVDDEGTMQPDDVQDGESADGPQSDEAQPDATQPGEAQPESADEPDDATGGGLEVTEDGTYTSKDEVALYIHTYGHLPSNFISKTKARNAGWVSSEGNLDEVCPGMSIGGSRFYNDDGLLPDKPGRTWTECDIEYHGGYRGGERIVFSNDGLVYYTGDHYSSFERLY